MLNLPPLPNHEANERQREYRPDDTEEPDVDGFIPCSTPLCDPMKEHDTEREHLVDHTTLLFAF